MLAGAARWWSSGGIGTFADQIHLISYSPQTWVDFIGKPPAYFNAFQVDGTPMVIANAVNLPVMVIGTRAQGGAMRRMNYVDVGALDAEYRAYGIVQPGIRLPADQTFECDLDDPDADCAQ